MKLVEGIMLVILNINDEEEICAQDKITLRIFIHNPISGIIYIIQTYTHMNIWIYEYIYTYMYMYIYIVSQQMNYGTAICQCFDIHTLR